MYSQYLKSLSFVCNAMHVLCVCSVPSGVHFLGPETSDEDVIKRVGLPERTHGSHGRA